MFSVVFELPVVSTPFNSGRVVPLGVEQAQNLKERLERLIEKKKYHGLKGHNVTFLFLSQKIEVHL